jgi:hypothetical protein
MFWLEPDTPWKGPPLESSCSGGTVMSLECLSRDEIARVFAQENISMKGSQQIQAM